MLFSTKSDLFISLVLEIEPRASHTEPQPKPVIFLYKVYFYFCVSECIPVPVEVKRERVTPWSRSCSWFLAECWELN